MTDRREKTLARLSWLREAISQKDAAINFLQAVVEGRYAFRYAPARRYQPTPADRARLPHTLDNLNRQKALWLCELQALLEYGV